MLTMHYHMYRESPWTMDTIFMEGVIGKIIVDRFHCIILLFKEANNTRTIFNNFTHILSFNLILKNLKFQYKSHFRFNKLLIVLLLYTTTDHTTTHHIITDYITTSYNCASFISYIYNYYLL